MSNKLKTSALVCGALVLLGSLYGLIFTPHVEASFIFTILTILFLITVKNQ